MIYIVLFLFSFSFTYFIKEYAIKKSLIAEVNERSSHTVPTPHGGGIALAITWFIGLIYLYFSNNIESNLFYALLVGIIISAVSFFDDIYELSPKIRLLSQALVALGGLYFLGGLDSLNFGFFSVENILINNIIAFIAIIWFINLYNFLDGINGYAASEMIFLSIAGFLLFSGSHFLVLIVSVLGFLCWNWNNAKIFMGDVGSTLLGYNIAIFTIYYANQEPLNLWIWITLFGLFWFDATLTLIRRKLNKEKLSQAHKKHAYQRLTQAGWSHFKVTNYSILVNILIFSLIVVCLQFTSSVFLPFFISLIVLYSIVKFIDKKKAFK